jgi:coniferyl-aldehyde dehydrogenase
MSILEAAPVMASPADTSDEAAIAALRAAFDDQRRAFTADRNPSIEERRRRIETLMGMMAANRVAISAALAADFGAHPAPAAH